LTGFVIFKRLTNAGSWVFTSALDLLFAAGRT